MSSWVILPKGATIIDDMISSGESMLDVVNSWKDWKSRGRVFVCTTFGLFTDGLRNLMGILRVVIFPVLSLTNLHYRRPGFDSVCTMKRLI